jgi:hypothetical protein
MPFGEVILDRLFKTYGPFTRCYDHPHWKTLTLEQRAKLMARQGQSFATAQEVRVVYLPENENDQELRDIPKDGRTVGEILMRGNMVMKEVCSESCARGLVFIIHSLVLPRPRSYTQGFPGRLLPLW